jgi:nitrate reductase NapE component
MKIARNEPCPCGSGSKYKNCCQPKDAASPSSGTKSSASTWIFAVLGVFTLLTIILTVGPFSRNGTDRTAGTGTATLPLGQGAAGSPAAQPPGPAPAGKVWSAEHGHWHDAAGTQTLPAVVSPQPAAPQPATSTPTPQPPGPAPAGKVWSAEHGHWHDLPQ